MIIQKYRANNDVNGNPRCLWVCFNSQPGTGEIVKIYNQSYTTQYPGDFNTDVLIPDVFCTVKEYRRLIRVGKQLDRYYE